MTESEYIQSIRNTAQRYLEVIRDPHAHRKDGMRRLQHWQAVKEKFSAHTLIALCDLWLDRRQHDAIIKAALELCSPTNDIASVMAGVGMERLREACDRHREHIAVQDDENRAPVAEEASAATMEA